MIQPPRPLKLPKGYFNYNNQPMNPVTELRTLMVDTSDPKILISVDSVSISTSDQLVISHYRK